MIEKLKNPRLNALLLGLFQGISKGPNVLPDDQFPVQGMDQNVIIITLFGLIAPPLLAAMSNALNRDERPNWWSTLITFINPFYFMFFAGVSFAIFRTYALYTIGADYGYGLSAFFASSGVGFLIGGILFDKQQPSRDG
ncbi:MAG: hypothetical protein DHS20C11_28560 [Lysobacteraceae bacterium]|nr:MAG: hypothetical protein DHS20C11_28560 [Xanthomonadaceae bacterium]